MNSEFNGRPEKQPESEAQFWRSLEELLPIFEREGIQLRLEPHPDDFIEDGREAVDMIRGINSPNVTFLYCAPHTFHMGGDMAGIMEYAGDLLTHLHVADSFDHRASSGLRYIVNPPGSDRARAPAPGHRPGRGRLGPVLRHARAARVRRDHDRVRVRLGGPGARVIRFMREEIERRTRDWKPLR